MTFHSNRYRIRFADLRPVDVREDFEVWTVYSRRMEFCKQFNARLFSHPNPARAPWERRMRKITKRLAAEMRRWMS